MSKDNKVDNSVKTKKNDGVKSDIRNDKLKLFSIGSFLILLVSVLAINIIFGLKINKTTIDDYLTYDMSSTGQNSVSEITISYLNSLPANTNIRIVGLFDKPKSLRDTPYEYIVPLLDDYVAVSGGRVTVEYINPTTYPSIISELDPRGVYDLANTSCYVISNGGNIIEIMPVDCFTYDSEYLQYGYYLPTSNIVESKFTSAIVNLTQGYSYKAYFVTGLGEGTHTQLSNMFSALGIESSDIQASDNFEVPADCDLLVINGISSDITSSMALGIQDYLGRGGKLIVAVNYYNTNVAESYPNLNSLLSYVNIRIQNALVMENDTSLQINSDKFNTLVNLNSAFTSMAGEATLLRNSYARPITTADTPFAYIQTQPVVTTSSNVTLSQFDENTGNLIQNSVLGQYNVGMYATYEGTPNPPEVYVFGTMTFTSDEYISNFGFNDANVVFTRNIVRALLKAEDTVFVEGKALSDYSIDTTKVTSNSVTVLTFVLIAIVPLALVIAGVIVYNKRKNL
ncbi:MAG: GldG family protein [Saccharofermentans sp.]|nr:GldG family protein [Saccharofermentans sp.]